MSIVSFPQNASTAQAASDDAIDRIEHDPAQLDLFDPPPTVISLRPCGRGGPCQAVVERGQDGLVLHCITCHCTAPYRAQKSNSGPEQSSTRTPACQSNDALGAVLNGFVQGQLKFMEFLREQ